jgi:beta-glucanase (GH16 family)
MHRGVLTCATALIALTVASPAISQARDADGLPQGVDWSEAHSGTPLDLSGFKRTFDDEFDDVRAITPDNGEGPWFAPVHATAGGATYRPPDYQPSPFSVSDGVLNIRAEKVNGDWQTGHMQTANSKGEGFSQKYGYFEIRAKMPPDGTMGAWPAFWLYSNTRYTDKTKTRAEIDIIEYYPGNDPRGYHAAVHLRPGSNAQPGEVTKSWWVSGYDRPDKLSDGDWHTYGAKVTPEWIIVYFDRKEVMRVPTLKEFKTPLYMLVSNSMVTEEVPQAKSPIDLKVDYVRVWSKAR